MIRMGIKVSNLKIKDIAKMAGVSTTAVSFALNNKEGISEETRKKILDIVNDCGYMPRTLMKCNTTEDDEARRRTGLILLLSCPNSPFTTVEGRRVGMAFYEIINSIENCANEKQYDLLFKSINMNEEFQNEVREVVDHHKVDGIIIASTAIPSKYIQQVQAIGVPSVAIDAYYADIDVDCIVMDNYPGAYKAGEYLYSLGHRKIGYLRSLMRINNFDERQSGFEAALKDHGIPLEEKYIYQIGSDMDECETVLREALTDRKDLPTALFAESDYLALGAMRILQKMGINVPGDISIIGFDNIPITSIMTPALTTVSVPWQDMADMAVDALIRRMDSGKKMSIKSRIGVELVIRDSCRLLDEKI